MPVIEVDAPVVPSQYAVITTNLATAVVTANPGAYSTPDQVAGLLDAVFDKIVSKDSSLGGRRGDTGNDPAQGTAEVPSTAPEPTSIEVGQADVPVEDVDEVVDEGSLDRIKRPQAKSLEGSSIVAGPWGNISQETRDKFEKLVRDHGLQMDERGYPLPKTPDGTIGGKDYVLDPFGGGKKYSMLKRRLKVHELTEDELIRFFGWEDREVRLVSEKYSEQKKRESIETGFVRKKGSKVGPRKAKVVEEA